MRRRANGRRAKADKNVLSCTAESKRTNSPGLHGSKNKRTHEICGCLAERQIVNLLQNSLDSVRIHGSGHFLGIRHYVTHRGVDVAGLQIGQGTRKNGDKDRPVTSHPTHSPLGFGTARLTDNRADPVKRACYALKFGTCHMDKDLIRSRMFGQKRIIVGVRSGKKRDQIAVPVLGKQNPATARKIETVYSFFLFFANQGWIGKRLLGLRLKCLPKLGVLAENF